jgi:hypothetical protein
MVFPTFLIGNWIQLWQLIGHCCDAVRGSEAFEIFLCVNCQAENDVDFDWNFWHDLDRIQCAVDKDSPTFSRYLQPSKAP